MQILHFVRAIFDKVEPLLSKQCEHAIMFLFNNVNEVSLYKIHLAYLCLLMMYLFQTGPRYFYYSDTVGRPKQCKKEGHAEFS